MLRRIDLSSAGVRAAALTAPAKVFGDLLHNFARFFFNFLKSTVLKHSPIGRDRGLDRGFFAQIHGPKTLFLWGDRGLDRGFFI